jgi:DNA-binding MarR family transcriptional regulator
MDHRKRILHLIINSVNRLKYYSIEKFEEAGVSVSPSQMGVLFLLMKTGSMNMTDLSTLMGIDNSTLTRLVDRLVKAGLVRRAQNPDDRRVWLVEITPHGLNAGEKALNLTHEINNLVMKGFTRKEIEIFIRVLLSFNEKFNSSKGYKL